MNKKHTERVITLPDGTKMRLSDLPLSAFAMSCGHSDRDYGVVKGDLYFCTECQDQCRVVKIVA